MPSVSEENDKYFVDCWVQKCVLIEIIYNYN